MSAAGAIKAGRAFVELFADNTKLVSGLKAATRKLKYFGKDVRNIGLKITAMGTAAGAPFAASAKAFGDFEMQMANVSTMLSDDSYMRSFTSGVQDLALKTGEGTETLAKGLYDILSASIPAGKAMKYLGVAAKAAKGGATTTAVAVDGLTSIMNAFKIEADQVTSVSDLMFATVKSGKITFEQLAGNIGKVAPMANAAGMSIDQMLASISTMTRQGLSAEEATTRLLNVLKVFPEAGKNIPALMAQFEGMSLKEILIKVPNIRAAGGIAALSGDLDGLKKDLALMGDSTGLAEAAFKKMDKTSSAAFAKLKQSVVAVAVSIGAALAPIVTDIAARISGTASVISNWIAENQKMIVSVAQIVAGVIGAGIALTVLGTVIGMVTTAFGVLGTVAGIALGVIGALLAVIQFLLSPIGILTVAIVGLVGVLVYLIASAGGVIGILGELGAAFDGLRDQAVAAIGAIGVALKSGDIGLAAEIFWGLLKVAWITGINWLLKLWRGFRDGFLKIANGTWSLTLIGAEFVWHGLKVGFRETIGFVRKLFEDFKGISRIVWNSVAGTITNALAAAWNGIVSLYNELPGVLQVLGDLEEMDTVNIGAGNRRISAETKSAKAGIDEGLAASRAEETKRHDKRVSDLVMDNAKYEANLNADRRAANKKDDAELAAAQKELAATIQKARELEDESSKKLTATKTDTGPDAEQKFKTFDPKAMDIGGIVSEQVAKIGTAGLFVASNAALAGLSGGGVQDKIAKNTEDTAKNTKRLLENMQTSEFE